MPPSCTMTQKNMDLIHWRLHKHLSKQSWTATEPTAHEYMWSATTSKAPLPQIWRWECGTDGKLSQTVQRERAVKCRWSSSAGAFKTGAHTQQGDGLFDLGRSVDGLQMIMADILWGERCVAAVSVRWDNGVMCEVTTWKRPRCVLKV